MARICALLAILWAFAWPAQAGAELLVGSWYGEGPQASGKYTQWIIAYKADATFAIRFRILEDCEIVGKQIEGGAWTLEPGRLILITTHVNGKPTNAEDPVFRDAYRVVRLDAEAEELVHETSGITFASRRVTADFSFPTVKRSDCHIAAFGSRIRVAHAGFGGE
jgi:hypothetical protein